MSDDDPDRTEIQYTYAQSQTRNDDIDTSREFHRQLASAILDIGVRHASPLQIVEQMTDQASCHHLTMDQVKSHLQRYRKVYKEHEKQKFLKDYDKFTYIIDRVYNHAQHPGSFAIVDLNHVVGGRAAAMVSHQVRAEYSNPDTNQRINVLDECSFFHTTARHGTRQSSARKPEHEGRPFDDHHHHQMKYDERIKTETDPTQSKQDRDFILIRPPKLTEKEKASPLGAAIQQILGVIQNFAEYIHNDEGRRPLTVPAISHIRHISQNEQEQLPPNEHIHNDEGRRQLTVPAISHIRHISQNEQEQLPPNIQIPTFISQIQPQHRLDHRLHQPRQREDEQEDHGHRQKQQKKQQYQSFPPKSDGGRLPMNTDHEFESMMRMDDVNNNDSFRLMMTQGEEEEDHKEIGDLVGLGRFYPIGDDGIVSDGVNAVGSVSSSKDGDIEDNKDIFDPP